MSTGITMKDKIKMTLVRKHMSQKELAKSLGCSPTSLSNRLKCGRFTYQELEEIAQAMGCQLRLEFVDVVTTNIQE